MNVLKTLKIELKWAFIFSNVALLWFIFEKMLGYHDEKVENQLFFAFIFAIPSLAIYFLAIKDKRKNVFKGLMTWKQGVVSGIFIALFVAIFSIIVNYICLVFISPDFFSNISKHVVATKAMTAVEAENYFNLKNYLLEGIYGALSAGVVASAIMAFFLKTK